MKVRVDFTIEIPRAALADLRAFMSSETNVDLAAMLRGEAEEHLVGYLDDNVCKVKVVQREGKRVNE